jgi:hypothetical protein
MDTDLAQMTREELIREVRRFRRRPPGFGPVVRMCLASPAFEGTATRVPRVARDRYG